MVELNWMYMVVREIISQRVVRSSNDLLDVLGLLLLQIAEDGGMKRFTKKDGGFRSRRNGY